MSRKSRESEFPPTADPQGPKIQNFGKLNSPVIRGAMSIHTWQLALN